jgi:uncharacterized protein YjbI with pentapeptide repeats
MTKIEIKNVFGGLIFTYEAKNATIKDAVEQAVRENVCLISANLSSADLSSANLRSADLHSANLRSADLRWANLSSADLSSANLSSANLSSADLSSANLRSADLHSANLRSANLRWANLSSADLSSADLHSADLHSAKNKETAYLPLFCKWNFSILGDEIQIGCEKRTIEQWDLFFASDEILSTKRGTEDFKQIQAIYNACKAYLLTLNKK